MSHPPLSRQRRTPPTDLPPPDTNPLITTIPTPSSPGSPPSPPNTSTQATDNPPFNHPDQEPIT